MNLLLGNKTHLNTWLTTCLTTSVLVLCRVHLQSCRVSWVVNPHVPPQPHYRPTPVTRPRILQTNVYQPKQRVARSSAKTCFNSLSTYVIAHPPAEWNISPETNSNFNMTPCSCTYYPRPLTSSSPMCNVLSWPARMRAPWGMHHMFPGQRNQEP
jgi:hypothetical protein